MEYTVSRVITYPSCNGRGHRYYEASRGSSSDKSSGDVWSAGEKTCGDCGGLGQVRELTTCTACGGIHGWSERRKVGTWRDGTAQYEDVWITCRHCNIHGMA